MKPSDPMARFNDLQRQGFMKPRKVRAPKVERPIVACDDCLNWHRRGKHTADPETRKWNRAERREHTQAVLAATKKGDAT